MKSKVNISKTSSRQLAQQLGRELRTSVLVVSLLAGIYGVATWLVTQAGTYGTALR